MSSKAGISAAQISAITDGTWRDHPYFSDGERIALEYAERLTATPPTVAETLVMQLREHFEPDVIVEMAAICAWENYRARFNAALGVEGHDFYQPQGE